MAAPGIKISELANHGNDISANLQKLFAAYGNDNYQVPLSALSSAFIKRDLAAFETAHLAGAWNYARVALSANDPRYPIDVANGNTLSDLQEIFDRFSTIWKIREPFVNEYMPTISADYVGKRWIIREDKNLEPRDAGTFHNVKILDAAFPRFPQTGINTIGPEGGYVFLKSVNRGMRHDVYMNVNDDFTDDVLSDLGWDDSWPDDKELKLVRYEIKPSSQVGVTFHCHYEALDSDESYASGHSFKYEGTVTAAYAGLSKTGEITYQGRPTLHTPDCSPHRDNHHWGEGDPKWPDLTGGNWKQHRDDHLAVTGSSGAIPGWHGVLMNVYNYCVEVTIHNVTITWAKNGE